MIKLKFVKCGHLILSHLERYPAVMDLMPIFSSALMDIVISCTDNFAGMLDEPLTYIYEEIASLLQPQMRGLWSQY